MDRAERRKLIGDTLQKHRKAAGFKSAVAFAEYMGINPSTYTDWEQGRHMYSFEQAWSMADFFGVSLDELGGREWQTTIIVDLSGDERSLVDSYRAATPRERYALITTAEAFRDGGLAKNNPISITEEKRA